MALTQEGGQVKTDWDRPHDVDAFPRPIGDEELIFLHRLRPEASLPELRDFLFQWWKKTMALDTQKYACVRQLYFLKTTIDENPKYREALSRKDRGGWWIDIGSAFGQDVRFPVLEGWPANRMLASDLIPELWEAGLSLYPNPGNIKYVTANVVDSSPSAERLQAYHGSADVVSSNLVFHTLGKDQVQGMLSAMISLLKPGGLLLGACAGSTEARVWTEYDPNRWLHSPSTLRDAFSTAGFVQIQIDPFDLPGGQQTYNKIGLRFSALRSQ